MLRTFVPVEPSAPPAATRSAPVVTNLSVHLGPSAEAFSDCDRDCRLDLQRWYRLEKDLCLCEGEREAWLYVELTDLNQLTAEDLVVINIAAGVVRPALCGNDSWSPRNGHMFVQREKFTGLDNAVTAVDVLFGEDAVDPRPRWDLLQSPLLLNAHANKPLPRLTFLRGKAEPNPDFTTPLRTSKNGEFKIVHISDMHLRTGVGTCDDALEKDGTRMGRIRADPKTLSFVETILETEKPDLVVLGGDQLHHDIDDSQTAIFKAAAPMIAHSVPWVIVFGNHDDEGTHALSRKSIFSSEPCWQGTIDHILDHLVDLCTRFKGLSAKIIIRVEAAVTRH